MLDNADWLTCLNYIDFVRDIGKHFSVNEMLAAETYRQRLESGLTYLEFSYRLLHPGETLPACTEKPFSDVEITNSFCAEITWMKESGISTGYLDGTFKPNAAVARQAMAAFMQRLFVETGGQARRKIRTPGDDSRRPDKFKNSGASASRNTSRIFHRWKHGGSLQPGCVYRSRSHYNANRFADPRPGRGDAGKVNRTRRHQRRR